VSVERYSDGENAVYEFITSTDDDGGDAATVFNVQLKRVFGTKYKCASFYREQNRIVLTLVSTGYPAVDYYPTDCELPYGNTHVCLQNEDERDVIFSFSTAKDHIPTLLLEDGKSFISKSVFIVLLVSLLLTVIFYY